MKGVSLSTTIFAPKGKPRLPADEAMARAAEAGFTQVEITRHHDEYEAVARAAERLGVSVWSIHGTLGGAHVFDDEEGRRASVRREVERLEACAVFAPCPYVIHYTNRVHDPRAGAAYRRSVEELAVEAGRLSITLAVETAPDKVQNERYPDSREITDFVRSLANPWVRICIDVNHSNLAEDLETVARNATGLIANIHVSDNHGTYEDHLLPGEGSIDLPGALRAIARAGYEGPVNLECHTPDQPTREELIGARVWAERWLGELEVATNNKESEA